MGFFSKIFGNKSFPLKELESAYQKFFETYTPEIVDFMSELGYGYSDNAGIHLDFNHITRANNILTEYALFLKACAIYYVRKNMIEYPEAALRSAFPLANKLAKIALSTPLYRDAIDGRISDYFNSVDKKIVRGYSTQNNFGPQNYIFIETIGDIDTMRFSLMFADCYYYIVKNEKYATTSEIATVKELAKNDSFNEAHYYLKIAERLKYHAEWFGEEIVKVLVNR